MKKRCCIIGSGIGGLSAAVKVAQLGYHVDIYEQSSSIGGKAKKKSIDSYTFDTGPSILTMPFVLESLFSDSNRNIDEFLNIVPLKNHCKYFYPDNTILTAYSNLNAFSSEAESKTGESADSIQKYLDYCSIIYDLSKDIFIFNDFHELSTFFQPTAIKTLFNISKIDSFRTMHNAISSFFNDKKIIQLFDRYATYNGSNPYKAPATLNIIPHVEYNMGSYIVEQGISSIPQALGRLCRDLGVNIFTNKRVDSIIHKNNRINGIQIGNEKLSYDIVISNSDAYYTYTKLLKDTSSRSAKKYIRQEPSSSAMVFYWGIDCIHDFLDIHNILFSSDYEREFNDIFNNKCFSADPTIYIYISSKYNKTHAPNGHENWFVMINTSYHNNHDWHRLKSEIRKNINAKIMRMLNIDIEKKIVCESVLTPKDIETDTGSYRGSIYGISSNNRSAAFLRQSNRSKKYKGLYFCGGSVHPGGGIPLVLMSGILAARAIEKYEAINR